MSDISITRLKNAPGSFTSFIFSVKVPKEQSTTGSDESYIVKGVNWLYKTVKYRAQQTPLSELQSLEYLRHSVLSRLNFEKNKNLPVLGLPVKSFWFYMPELPNTSRARFTTLPPQKRIELQMEDRLKESQDYLETGRYNRNAEKELEESDEESSEDTSSSSYISDSEGSSYASSEESESSESSSFSSSEESGSTIDSRKAPAPRKPLTLTPLTKEYITIVRTVSGTSLNRYIKEYTPEDSQEIQEIFFQVGRSLGEFHYLVARPQEKEALKRADFDNFKTTTHGDFHPGNIFWDSTLNRVGFIDLATMAEAHRKPKPFWHDIFRFYYFAKYIEWYNGKRTLNQFNELMEKFILGYCEAYPEEVRRDLMVYLSQELASWTKTVLLVYQSLKQGSFDIDFPEYSKRDTTNPENDYDPVIFAQEVYGRSLYKINRAQEDLMMDSFLKK